MAYELTDPKTVSALLARHGLALQKARGQNFLINPTVCPRMARACGAGKADAVLEIGPGVGVLTRQLAAVAGQVLAVEVDHGLIPLLAETVGDLPNVQVVEGDILKLDLADLWQRFENKRVFVCANLPYYITTPILMALLESGLPIAGMTVMVQKEFAARLCAPVGSRQSGALTVAAAYHAHCEAVFSVARGSFLPAPKVDSTVIRLTPHAAPPVTVTDEAFFFKTVKAAFGQRRKTLPNALSAGLGVEKSAVVNALAAQNLPAAARAEQLTLPQLAALANALRADV